MEMAGIENTAAYHEKEKSRPGESSRPAFCTNSPGRAPAKVDGKVPVKRTDAVMNEESAAGRCRLSVIVPVFNMASEERLSFCMGSLLQQTISDYEILAVDDCSTDSSLEILRELEKQHPDRIRVIASDRNRHQGGAKNLGIARAKGEWIAFIDADDWVVPDYFDRLLKKAEETGADCVGTDYCIVHGHTMTPGPVVANSSMEQTGVLDDEKRRLLILDSGSLCVKIYRREIVADCPSRFPEDIFYEDNALANTWIMRMKHFEYVPGPLYYYYQHEDSTVHTVTKRRLEDRLTAGRVMISEAEHYGFLERFRPEIEYSFTVLFYKNTIFSALQGMKEKGVYSFVTGIAEEMRRTFPDFQSNPYYLERTNEEEKKLMRLQMKSPIRFYVYYRMLWMYRRIRYGKTLQ